jgi:hypothetical protein
MKRPALVIAALVAFVIISVAFSAPPEVKYKNLKVLPKNTNKQQLDSIMNHFARSLGVRCNFCHVRANDAQKNWDFANDSSAHKVTARSMMRMTAKLNKKYFKEEMKKDGIPALTCFSCHNGKEHPATIPPPPPPRQQPTAPPAQTGPTGTSGTH